MKKAKCFSGFDAQESVVVLNAMEILSSYARKSCSLSSPALVRDYLRLRLATEQRECFVAVWLDAQKRALEFETLSVGTLTQTSVYPRETVKAALAHNAASVIFAHNHPSGLADPSRADEVLTQALKHALALVDVKVVDHFIVTASNAVSFAERGLL